MPAPLPTGAGDDLEDGLDLDARLLASSDVGSGSDVGAEDGEQEEEDERIYLSAEEEEEKVVVAGKRKAEDGGEGEGDKKRRKEEKRPKRHHALVQPSTLSPEALYDYFYQSLRKTYAKGSEIELAELKLPTNAVLSTSSFTGERSLTTLPEFIKTQLPPLPSKLKKPGTPALLILSLSGMRCADLVRALRPVAGGAKAVGGVGKLFGKDKIADQIEFLGKSKVLMVVGTPGRVAKILATSDALTIRQQTVILLDQTFEDSKKRTLLTIPEIRDELWRGLLGDPVVRGKVLQPGVRFGVF